MVTILSADRAMAAKGPCTVIAVFERISDAQRALRVLHRTGIAPDHVTGLTRTGCLPADESIWDDRTRRVTAGMAAVTVAVIPPVVGSILAASGTKIDVLAMSIIGGITVLTTTFGLYLFTSSDQRPVAESRDGGPVVVIANATEQAQRDLVLTVLQEHHATAIVISTAE